MNGKENSKELIQELFLHFTSKGHIGYEIKEEVLIGTDCDEEVKKTLKTVLPESIIDHTMLQYRIQIYYSKELIYNR